LTSATRDAGSRLGNSSELWNIPAIRRQMIPGPDLIKWTGFCALRQLVPHFRPAQASVPPSLRAKSESCPGAAGTAAPPVRWHEGCNSSLAMMSTPDHDGYGSNSPVACSVDHNAAE
jgi:hypothetical protein